LCEQHNQKEIFNWNDKKKSYIFHHLSHNKMEDCAPRIKTFDEIAVKDW